MKPLLSICIFNYNDAKYWKDLVMDALSLKDERFQILLQDNCSTDESETTAKSITDKRFIFRKNERNVGAPINAVRCLQNNNSEYCLLAMTRDRLNIGVLPEFLDYLEKERPDFGILTISSREMEIKKEIFRKGFEALSRSYLGRHSTGHFWKTSLIDRELGNERFWENIKDSNFTHDLINGGAAVDHSLTEINLKVFTQIKYFPNCNRVSYTDPKDIYFLPENRIKNLNVYFAHINSLDIKNELKEKTAEFLLRDCIDRLTYGVMDVYQNGNPHYKIASKKHWIKDFYKSYSCALEFIKNQNYFNETKKEDFIKIIQVNFFRNIRAIYTKKYRSVELFFKLYGKINTTKNRLLGVSKSFQRSKDSCIKND